MAATRNTVTIHDVARLAQVSISTGFKWYDKTNVDSEEMKPLLYD